MNDRGADPVGGGADPELEALGARMSERFVQQLREDRARAPGRSVLFPKVGDATLRRQIVRWLGREEGEPTPGSLEVLRTALDDDDWEVRVSAMVVAARVRAARLRPVVKEVRLPAAHQFGLDEGHVGLLVALRAIATEALDCGDVADVVSAVAARLDGVPRDVVRAALAPDGVPRTSTALFVHALTTPHELEDPLPATLPAGITRIERQLFLAGTIEMVWVSPTTHLLGGEARSAPRAWTPGRGFFAARRPLTAESLAQLGIVVPGGDVALPPALAERIAQTPEPPVAVSHAEALRLCVALGHRAGAGVDLPSADELECAARGTDGRRYSWGNGIERLTGRERSPHGIERFAVPAPQWTSSRDASLVPLALGGPDALLCAARPPRTEGAAVRPVVRAV